MKPEPPEIEKDFGKNPKIRSGVIADESKKC